MSVGSQDLQAKMATENDDLPKEPIYDDQLNSIFKAEGQSIGRFFDVIFDYFFRNCPDKIFDPASVDGQQLLTSYYSKWHSKYKESVNGTPKSSKRQRTDSSSAPESSRDADEKDHSLDGAPNLFGPTNTTNTTTISKRSSEGNVTSCTKSKIDKIQDYNFFDTANGATLEKYAWTQNVDDLEVRIPVSNEILKGTQVKVKIETKKLVVDIMNNGSSEFVNVINGDLCHPVKSGECVWLLVPQNHISILLEKVKDIWWDRLLLEEAPIDLKKINAERAFSSLPDEDKVQLEKVITDKRKKELGEPTSDQAKMESMLRKAWDVEGSPFKGQPFDPSIVKFANSE